MTLQESSDGGGENERDEGILKDEYFLTDDFYEYEQGQADIIVKDRLRKHIQFWHEIGTDPFILDIIENGYVIPFHSTPNSMFSKNNKSALQNEEFVLEAIKDLEIKGLIATGTINLSQLRDVTKALPGKLPVQIKFRLFPIDCDVRDVLF